MVLGHGLVAALGDVHRGLGERAAELRRSLLDQIARLVDELRAPPRLARRRARRAARGEPAPERDAEEDRDEGDQRRHPPGEPAAGTTS